MNPVLENQLLISRRHFFGRASTSIGVAALGSLLNRELLAGDPATLAFTARQERGGGGAAGTARGGVGGLPEFPNFAPRAKRVIYLFQSGAPSQMDLFDYKPALEAKRGIELPNSIRMGQRITTMTSGQKNFPVAPSIFKFARQGKCGAWLSELLPHTA